MTKHDVIIIGAGPAGSYLAYKLRNLGINTLILEKNIFPRYKTCGGGLSRKAYDILYSDNKEIENIVEKKIKKGLYIRGNKVTIRESDEDLIYMTYRSNLDNYLVKMAVDNKTVFLKENVTIKKINQREKSIVFKENKKEQTVHYNVLIGAWGNNVKLNRQVDLYPFKRFAISSSWEGSPGPRFSKYFNEYAVCQIMKKYPGVVGYIFPKSKKITAGLFTSLYPVSFNLKNAWNEFAEFWKLDTNIHPRYAVIPVRDFNKPIAQENILLIGDAAGLADSFTGEGLYQSFISSMIASKNIKNYLENDKYELAKNYTQEINKQLLDMEKWAVIYEFLFHHFPNFSFWLGSESFLGYEILKSFLTGNIRYNEIRKILNHFIKKSIHQI
jgi:geranylgeranyl reductase family protein